MLHTGFTGTHSSVHAETRGRRRSLDAPRFFFVLGLTDTFVCLGVGGMDDVMVLVSVAAVPNTANYSGPGATYRFTLPHEVAGFCTLLLPRGTPSGMKASFRHGEAVDMGTNLLVDVECTYSLNSDPHLHGT